MASPETGKPKPSDKKLREWLENHKSSSSLTALRAKFWAQINGEWRKEMELRKRKKE